MIKFFDVRKQDKNILYKFNKRIKNLYKTSDFINGEETIKFEKNFQNLIKSKYLLTCNSGTDAIFIALKSLKLKKNSEVILPAMTYCSAAYSVIRSGFILKLVDVEKNRSTICPKDLKNKITKKTSAVIATHLHGGPCNIKEIKKIIRGKKIKLIEDVAQAHGAFDASYGKRGKILGSIGDAGCFSFYPGKNLGAYGDAGAISFKSKNSYNYAKVFKNNGTLGKYKHENIGINSRLDSIQSIFLDEKLKFLKKNNNKRKKIAKFYFKNITNSNIKKLKYYPGAVFHQYVIITKKINKLIKEFNKEKIEFGRHYPYTINQLPSLKKYFSKKEKYKNAEIIAKFGISLPIDPNLSIYSLQKIVKIINKL